MKKGQPHPAAALSKSLLASGLISLLQKKAYTSITITQLCHHAQVARRTFYRNFTSIDEVLEYYINELISEFEEDMKQYASSDYHEMITAYFTFWSKYAEFLKLLNKNGLIHFVFHPYIKCLINLPFICAYNKEDSYDEQVYSCKLAYTAGGLWSLLTYWSASGCRETPKELADIVLL